jgi:hypothetical protein
METPGDSSIGVLDGKKIRITNAKFIDEVKNQFQSCDCKDCEVGNQCPHCAVVPYLQGNLKEYTGWNNYCGFTHAMIIARLHFRKKLEMKKWAQKGEMCNAV